MTNTNMRKGFTMIELIFVIVIIGILAAVAIPKLAATRDDARISNIIANTRTLAGDFSSFYTSQGNTKWIDSATYVSEVSNVPVWAATKCNSEPIQQSDAVTAAGSSFFLCDEKNGVDCITVVTDANGTQYTIESAADGASVICDGVVNDNAIIGLTGGPGQTKIHKLGGVGVNR